MGRNKKNLSSHTIKYWIEHRNCEEIEYRSPEI